jgi:hypothetical protein
MAATEAYAGKFRAQHDPVLRRLRRRGRDRSLEKSVHQNAKIVHHAKAPNIDAAQYIDTTGCL